MNTPLKNPCLECDHHLAGGDKNCEQCRDCVKRVEYVNAIGKCPSSTMSEHVDLEGGGGPDLSNKNQTTKDSKTDPVENYIMKVCKAGNISMDQLRAGIKGFQDPDKKQEINLVRDEIIRILASGKFGHFTQPQIGKLLNISGPLVCQRMKLMNISLRPRDRQKTNTPGMPVKKAEPKTTNKTLTLIFDNHPELYDDLQKMADSELRAPDQQILWILLKVQENGMNLQP